MVLVVAALEDAKVIQCLAPELIHDPGLQWASAVDRLQVSVAE